MTGAIFFLIWVLELRRRPIGRTNRQCGKCKTTS